MSRDADRVVNCHGSFATATCVTCAYKCEGSAIEDDILNQRIARCPKCPPPQPPTSAECTGLQSDCAVAATLQHDAGEGDDGREATKEAPVCDLALPSHVQQALVDKKSDEEATINAELFAAKAGGKDPTHERGMGSAACGVMKPDIVFFKEALPGDFFSSLRQDLETVDLVLVIGTSLRVAPVSDIVSKVDAKVPAILINREVVRCLTPPPLPSVLPGAG